MTAAAAIRATILMALMPDVGYAGVLAAVFGDLVLVPWQRPSQVPAPKVLGTWRAALGPAPLARLQARVLAAAGGEHRGHHYRAVHAGELPLGSIDGPVTRSPAPPSTARRSARPGPLMTRRPIRRSVTCWPATPPPAARWRWSPAPAAGPGGGQALLDAMLTQYPGVFTSDRIWVLDRNFPGADRAARMLATGTRVLIRVLRHRGPSLGVGHADWRF